MGNHPYEYDREFRPISNSSITVYKGILNGLDIAIKRAKTKEAYDALRRESEILSSIDFTGIPKFYGQNPNDLEIYMSFINGTELNTEQKNTQENKLKILTGLADMLDYLHSIGIVHNDVKPRNIIINNSSDPALIDFDLSYSVNKLPEEFKLYPRYSSGYTAPEKLDLIYSPQSDTFSFGVIAYELFTGRNPFRADEADKLAYQKQVKNGPVIPLLLPDKKLEQTIEKCLCANPDERPRMHSVKQLLYSIDR